MDDSVGGTYKWKLYEFVSLPHHSQSYLYISQQARQKKKMLLTAFTIDQQLYLRRPVSFYPEFWATALLKKNILIIKKF